MTLRLPLSGKRHATVVSAYAPTMTNPDEVKDKFYDDVDSVISAAARTDKLILLGEFNVRVGTGHQTWEGVIGSEGVGKCNSNGLLLLRKCAEHELLITNIVFRLPTRRKTSWMHPRSKLQTLASHCHSVKEGQTGCQSDKDFVWCRLLDRSQACCQQTQPAYLACTTTTRQEGAKTLDVSKLKQDSKRQAFVNGLCSRSEHSSEDVDESWTVFRDIVHSSAMDSLGPVSRKHQDWFDENDKEIQGLLEEKHQKNTRLTLEIPAQYLVRLPIQTYARQYRLGSETCKTPG